MKLDDKSIEQLVPVINGDIRDCDEPEFSLGLTIYKNGLQLVSLFNNYGYPKDVYNAEGVRGLPDNLSRSQYTKSRLTGINNTKHLENLINNFVFSRNYTNTDYDIDAIAIYINNIIKYNGYELKLIDDEYIVTGNSLLPGETMEVEPTFEYIQNKIIEEIRNAKYTIWVAVAWFTDDILFNELIEKKKQGVNIQIIVSDDSINSKIKFEEYFETHRIKDFNCAKNIFHSKFCVIDLETVIHGSYNWTKRAQFNKEDIVTIKNSPLTAKKYADTFINLKLM